jgi:hypothetical protein
VGVRASSTAVVAFARVFFMVGTSLFRPFDHSFAL